VTDLGRYREELGGETRRILRLLDGAGDSGLQSPSACSGWTVLDVGRHVEVTPRSVAANIDAHLAGIATVPVDRIPPNAGAGQVLDSLRKGADALDGALSRLSTEKLDGTLPGPAGPMPARAALDLALTELTLHRCDIELGLGQTPEIARAVGERIVDVLQAWLLLLAPSDPVPDQPWCVELRGHTRSWFFSFDGVNWSASPCPNGELVRLDPAAPPILALAGRTVPGSVSGALRRLKVFLPGP
jgi:uncharacterized protein (TIGR03083 family)